VAKFGFDLRLDRFEVVRYEPEHRVAYYRAEEVPCPDGKPDLEFRLKASFDPEVGVKHLLPGGDSFRIKTLAPEYGTEGKEMKNPAALLEVRIDGDWIESPLLFAHQPGKNSVRVGDRGALVFEKRNQETKADVSNVTVVDGGKDAATARVLVNDPFTYKGWTFYQAECNPNDPTFSGLQAVRDPGVNWVFLGFFLICVGVAWMFYVDNRMKKAPAPAARPESHR
jgi:hypothetical protein